jgi:hypothetical protein
MGIPIHSEPDAKLELVGEVHMEKDPATGALVLVCGDVNIAKEFAAALGILRGGSQLMLVELKATKITMNVTTSSQSFSGAFDEPSEPVFNGAAATAKAG